MAVKNATLDETPVLRIRPSRGWAALNLRELWEYRELIFFLMWRDIQVRYKQTVLGVAWVVVQPLATTLIFTVIFGDLAGLPSGGLPYAVFALAGLVPWSFFASALARGGTSLVSSASLISKVYFPRLVIPIAGVLGGVADLVIGLVLLLGITLFFGLPLGPSLLAVPAIILLALGVGLGISLWLSALNVQYRDVTYLIPFLAQIWFYLTPIVYPVSLLPERWRIWVGLNPMATVVEAMRWAVLGAAAPPAGMSALSAGVVVALLVSGAIAFQRMEATFADVV